MDHDIACYRCGASLAALSLPFSRRDACPACSADVHVCRQCVYFDAAVPRQCREDGAEEVREKDRANFCDWFRPDASAFDPARKADADAARNALDSLFGDADATEPAPDPGAAEAGKLFK